MPLNHEELQAIRTADEAAGPDLQTCPPAWQHRRALLEHIDALGTALVFGTEPLEAPRGR